MVKVVPWRVLCSFATVLLVTSQSLAAETADAIVLLPAEKEAVRELVAKQSARVSNLFVRFVATYEPDNPNPQCETWEWAVSGTKVYRKRWWSVPVGAPLPKRWGIAVWDGALLKGYDSEVNGGSVRAQNDWRDAAQPSTYSTYCQLLGTLNHGTFAELLAANSLDKWDARWLDPGKKVIFSSDTISCASKVTRYSWTLDLDRGGLIVESTIDRIFPSGSDYEPYLRWTIDEAREVEPGLWLPTKAHKRFEHLPRDATAKVVSTSDLVVMELRVNDPSIEDSFAFEFPKGSKYYDHTIGKSVTAGAVDEGQDLAAGLDAMADDLGKTVAKPVGTAANVSRDDLAVADELAAARKTATPGRSPQALWICMGVACVVAAVLIVLLGALRARRQR